MENSTFKIFTDNASNIPYNLILKYDIGIVPVQCFVKNKALDPDAPFDGASFYKKMREGENVSTSMPNISAFTDSFKPVLNEGTDILYIGMSGGISGTAALAQTVVNDLREEYPNRRIESVDSKGASLGEGLPVLFAAMLRESGRDLSVTLATVKEKCNHMHQVFTVDNLKYLQKTGRLFSAAVKLTTTLSVKPILFGDKDGHIILKSVAIGRKRALDVLAKKYKEECTDMNARIGVAHADAPDDADYLIKQLQKAGCRGSILNVMYEPVTGSHVGPGTVALFFYSERRT